MFDDWLRGRFVNKVSDEGTCRNSVKYLRRGAEVGCVCSSETCSNEGSILSKGKKERRVNAISFDGCDEDRWTVNDLCPIHSMTKLERMSVDKFNLLSLAL